MSPTAFMFSFFVLMAWGVLGAMLSEGKSRRWNDFFCAGLIFLMLNYVFFVLGSFLIGQL